MYCTTSAFLEIVWIGGVAHHYDDASKVGMFAFGATITSTAVLAMGWHTLTWSLGGLFLPLLPFVIIGTVITALFRQKDALNDNDRELA